MHVLPPKPPLAGPSPYPSRPLAAPCSTLPNLLPNPRRLPAPSSSANCSHILPLSFRHILDFPLDIPDLFRDIQDFFLHIPCFSPNWLDFSSIFLMLKLHLLPCRSIALKNFCHDEQNDVPWHPLEQQLFAQSWSVITCNCTRPQSVITCNCTRPEHLISPELAVQLCTLLSLYSLEEVFKFLLLCAAGSFSIASSSSQIPLPLASTDGPGKAKALDFFHLF